MSSRRDIPSKTPGVLVTVGWDNPMSTFFAQVIREDADEDGEDRILLWLGSEPRECLRAADLVAPLAPFAVVSPEILAALNTDRAADLDRAPSRLQRFFRNGME